MYLAVLLLGGLLASCESLFARNRAHLHAFELLRNVPLDGGLVAHGGRREARAKATNRLHETTLTFWALGTMALRGLINRLWLNPAAKKPFQYRGDYRTPAPGYNLDAWSLLTAAQLAEAA